MPLSHDPHLHHCLAKRLSACRRRSEFFRIPGPKKGLDIFPVISFRINIPPSTTRINNLNFRKINS